MLEQGHSLKKFLTEKQTLGDDINWILETLTKFNCHIKTSVYDYKTINGLPVQLKIRNF